MRHQVNFSKKISSLLKGVFFTIKIYCYHGQQDARGAGTNVPGPGGWPTRLLSLPPPPLSVLALSIYPAGQSQMQSRKRRREDQWMSWPTGRKLASLAHLAHSVIPISSSPWAVHGPVGSRVAPALLCPEGERLEAGEIPFFPACHVLPGAPAKWLSGSTGQGVVTAAAVAAEAARHHDQWWWQSDHGPPDFFPGANPSSRAPFLPCLSAPIQMPGTPDCSVLKDFEHIQTFNLLLFLFCLLLLHFHCVVLFCFMILLYGLQYFLSPVIRLVNSSWEKRWEINIGLDSIFWGQSFTHLMGFSFPWNIPPPPNSS